MSNISQINPAMLERHLLDLSCEVDKLKLSLDAIVRIADDGSTSDPDEQSDALLQIEALAKVLAEFAEKTAGALHPNEIIRWAESEGGAHD